MLRSSITVLLMPLTAAPLLLLPLLLPAPAPSSANLAATRAASAAW
jgi:hypothetical protein